MTRTVHFSFKPEKLMTINSIRDLLEKEGFNNFNIHLPKERSFTGPPRSLRRGFVFIRFRNRGDAIRLVDTMNGKQFFSGTLKISMKSDGENVYSSDESRSGSDCNASVYDSDD